MTTAMANEHLALDDWKSFTSEVSAPHHASKFATVVTPVGPAHTTEFVAKVGVSVQGAFWLSGEDLVLPIYVRLEVSLDTGDLTVVDPNTDIFGTGSALSEAVADFHAALVDHRTALEESAALSADLEGQLRYLRSHMRPAAS